MVKKFTEKNIKKLGFWDMQFAKASVLFFAFFIASFILGFVERLRWWWLVLFVVCSIKPLMRIFKK